MDVKKQQALVAAAVACFIAAAGTASFAGNAHAEDKVPCYGINACKGTGDCGGKGHACGGKNECAGQGFLKLDKDTCMKIKGGRLTPEEMPKQ